ncbi:70e44d9e-e8d6-441c-823d-2167c6a2bbb3 [Thermothielavioides terrestris]|uniref:70e44d9e-e8d6-441c-823d-2167c6a2bbb3 n=1 Tax=Thermothielavioides terrestris TaxID=2587410 RepID=A0A446BPF0_9PEZI|nr:70e44d9e-e8d6-441c-823d-2167c6a2bbb3 [Thermothielavioides terrestris]
MHILHAATAELSSLPLGGLSQWLVKELCFGSIQTIVRRDSQDWPYPFLENPNDNKTEFYSRYRLWLGSEGDTAETFSGLGLDFDASLCFMRPQSRTSHLFPDEFHFERLGMVAPTLYIKGTLSSYFRNPSIHRWGRRAFSLLHLTYAFRHGPAALSPTNGLEHLFGEVDRLLNWHGPPDGPSAAVCTSFSCADCLLALPEALDASNSFIKGQCAENTVLDVLAGHFPAVWDLLNGKIGHPRLGLLTKRRTASTMETTAAEWHSM